MSPSSFPEYIKFCILKLCIMLVIKEKTLKNILIADINLTLKIINGEHSLDNLPWGTMKLKKLGQRSAFGNCLTKVICLKKM